MRRVRPRLGDLPGLVRPAVVAAAAPESVASTESVAAARERPRLRPAAAVRPAAGVVAVARPLGACSVAEGPLCVGKE